MEICDAPMCTRPGKLVQQFVVKGRDFETFVFRSYLCQWHLGSQNRHRLNCQPKLSVIEYKPDSEFLEN